MVAFDERTTTLGRWLDRNGAVLTTTTSFFGVSGNNISTSHPWPYLVGGGWDMTKSNRHDALVSGREGTTSYENFQAFIAATPPNASIAFNKTVNNVLANTNPSRPVVDLPVAIAELRDLPHLFKIAGDTFLKKGAGAYLNYQFGWKPFLSDLKGILDFQGHVDRRTRELTKLYENGGSRHRASNGSGQYQTYKPSVGTFKGSTVRELMSGSAEAWITVRWVPDFGPTNRPPSSDEIRHKAFRAVFGLEASLSTVWEALPWSWLIDWFSDMGDYLQSQRNVVGFHPGQCFQMTHYEGWSSRWIDSDHPTASPNLTVDGPATLQVTRKVRTLANPASISASVPFLTGRQLGILASLAILRR